MKCILGVYIAQNMPERPGENVTWEEAENTASLSGIGGTKTKTNKLCERPPQYAPAPYK